MNRQRAQGTAAEVRVEARHLEWGFEAELLRSRGKNDTADVRVEHPVLGRIWISVKDGERLNGVAELQRVQARSGGGRDRSVVFQTQKYRPTTDSRRRNSRRAVLISEELWFELLDLAAKSTRRR